MLKHAFFIAAVFIFSLGACAQTTRPSREAAELKLSDAVSAKHDEPQTQPEREADDPEPTTLPVTPPGRPTTRPIPAIQRAIVISIDGCRPDLLLRANTPNLHHMIAWGSFSMWARTTAMSITLPSHTSMLTGVPPDRHEIFWNKDEPFSKPVYPSVPTLFEMAHRSGYTTAMAAGKNKFQTLNKPGTVDWSFIPKATKTEDPEVAAEAVKIIREHRPEVLFVHLPSTDSMGHKIGWGTPDQIKAIEGADECIGKILMALEEEHLLHSTFIIVSADHGGAGRTHGPDDPRSRHIPWIAFGPGIRKNLDLTTYPKLEIHTEDTFATVCWVLGIPLDLKTIDGKPITEIMPQSELLHAAPAK